MASRMSDTRLFLKRAGLLFSIACAAIMLPRGGTTFTGRGDPAAFDIRTRTSPAPLDTIGVSRSIQIGAEPVFGGANDGQGFSDVAFNGEIYLVVWQDGRTWCTFQFWPFYDYWGQDIFAARVSQDGTLLDPVGFLVCSTDGSQGYPSVASDGTDFLVSWHDQGRYRTDIYAARVTAEGEVLDPSGILLSDPLVFSLYPDVASSGSNYLVVWTEYRESSYDIMGARVGLDGTVLEPHPIVVSDAAEWQQIPSVAFGGTDYFAVWRDERNGIDFDIYGCHIGVDGTVIDSAGIALITEAADQEEPSLAFNGTDYLVVWEDERNGGADIYGSRVNTAGAVLDPGGIPVSTAGGAQENPQPAFNNTTYFVAWQDRRSGPYADIYGARISFEGSILDTAGIPIALEADNLTWPAVSFGGTNCLVIWNGHDVYGKRITDAGTLLDTTGILFSVSAGTQRNPAMAFDGTNYLVVWEETQNQEYDIYGARLSPLGAVLDPGRIAISTAVEDQRYPAVAFNDTNFIVVWEDRRVGSFDIYGARVSTDGAVLDTAGLVISAANDFQRFPDIAFGATSSLVAWEDKRDGSVYRLYGSRVGADGTIIDPDGLPFGVRASGVDLAFDGTNYVAVWHAWDILAARITAAGELLDSTGIVISSGMAAWGEGAAIAFGDSNYLVVWADDRNGYFDIYGTRLDVDGADLDSGDIVISAASGEQKGASVVFDGCDYVVAWDSDCCGAYSDVYVTRVSADGAVLDTSGTPLATDPLNEAQTCVAAGPGSDILVGYSAFTLPEYGSYRIWGNFISAIAGGPVDNLKDIPVRITIESICPIPASQGVTIRYVVPTEVVLQAHVYDVEGRHVATLLDGVTGPGRQSLHWDGLDGNGNRVVSGLYFCRIRAGQASATGKFLLLR